MDRWVYRRLPRRRSAGQRDRFLPGIYYYLEIFVTESISNHARDLPDKAYHSGSCKRDLLRANGPGYNGEPGRGGTYHPPAFAQYDRIASQQSPAALPAAGLL